MNTVTHAVIILDRSSSMYGLRYDVVKQVNKQFDAITANSHKFGQKTNVSFVTFASGVDKPTFFEKDSGNVPQLRDDQYSPSGSTALFDAIGETVKRLSAVDSGEDSFLVIVA